MTAVHCPVHGPGYGRCLGCLLEALYAIRHIQNPSYDEPRRRACGRPAGRLRGVGSRSKAPPAFSFVADSGMMGVGYRPPMKETR